MAMVTVSYYTYIATQRLATAIAIYIDAFKPFFSGQSGLNTYTSPPLALTGARLIQTSGKLSNISMTLDKGKEFVTNAQPALVAIASMFPQTVVILLSALFYRYFKISQ